MDITVTKTKLDGVVLIDTDFFRDERGFFIEVWHAERYREHGLPGRFRPGQPLSLGSESAARTPLPGHDGPHGQAGALHRPAPSSMSRSTCG